MTEPVSETTVRSPKRPHQIAYNVLAVVLAFFVLIAVNTNLFGEQPNLALFGMLGLTLVFLSRPAIKRWGRTIPVQLFDLGLVVATIVTFGYVFVQSERMLERFWIDGTLLGDRA